MSVIRTLPAVTLLFSLGLTGCTNDQGVPSAVDSSVPAKRAYAGQAERERRVMTAEEKGSLIHA